MQFQFRTILWIFLSIAIPLALTGGAVPLLRAGLASAIGLFWLSGFLLALSAHWGNKLAQQLTVMFSGLVLFSLSFVATTYVVGQMLVKASS
ncbi:MAG: hypothetical protein VB878_21785 [Pirellulaceae bacterium]|jgi:hypothetical protein